MKYEIREDKYCTYYYLNGKRHRKDGPAIEYNSGAKSWWLNGKLHREDGHAVEWDDGSKFWYLNGKLHREDGPAIECINGNKFWFLNNIEHTEKEYWEKVKCKYCGGKYRSVKAINTMIYYCPRCQR